MTASKLTDALLLAVLAFVPAGCERQKTDTSLPVGAVRFESASVVLVPGDNWQQLRTGPFTTAPDICLPVLQGQGEFKGGVIQVYSSPSDRSDPQTRAAAIHREISTRQQVVKDSFREEKFTAATGVRGVHVSYDLKVGSSGGLRTTRAHVYIVNNKKGACVGVSYTTLAETDSEAVQRMIQETLRLH